MAYTANKALAQCRRRLVDFDPDSGSETIVTLNPAASEKCLALTALGGLRRVVAALMHSVGTGSITGFKIFVADNAAGTTNAAVVATHALGSDPNAVGDYLFLEASAEQLRAASATAAYWGVKITLGTSTDECVVYAEEHGKQAYDQVTADYVS
ncbi:MAG TPA: hypothetical protein VEC39_14500 [Vicinamibacterales bacterium]|nr:hypothetical protein [Vicinamibacterales bacterium]